MSDSPSVPSRTSPWWRYPPLHRGQGRAGFWRVVLRAAAYVGKSGHPDVWRLVKHSVGILRESGFRALQDAVASQIQCRQRTTPEYDIWLAQDRLDEQAKRRLQAALEACEYQPTISIIVPVANPDVHLLRRCIESVKHQLYPRWELCIADDSSTRRQIRALLEPYASTDPRIRVVCRERGGDIAAASNSALGLATGELVALLDHDDELSADALLQNVLVLNEHRDADFIYSDEDRIDDAGTLTDPYFKPDWSPETFLGNMYLGRLCVYRRSIVEEVGGFRQGLEGSRDYDLALRVTEKTCRIHHIPRVLYHRRMTQGSAAAGSDVSSDACRAALEALNQALARRGMLGSVEPHPQFPGFYIVRVAPDLAQKVSIIIPTRDRADLLERCLESLFALTTHPTFEVCVVDNGSRKQATLKLLERFRRARRARFRVIRHDIPFNFSALVNAGVAETDGELVLLLNNDTEVLDGSWLEQMAGYAQRGEIGAVGCVLLYPDRTVQHGGVILTAGGVARHSHAGQPSSVPGYFGRLLTQSNYAAVTAACVMVRRELFVAAGGFDDQLGVTFNDVDFCLRLLQKGYRNVCLGQVRLLHRESKSRGWEDSAEKRARFAGESALMRERWAPILDRDPYYNPNLRGLPPDFTPAIAAPERPELAAIACSGLARSEIATAQGEPLRLV